MLFEDALYYPTIDIKDEGWLKSAVLLWDHIRTIVPESERYPYRTDCSRSLSDAEVLRPHHVNPHSVNFPMLERAVRDYLDTPDGKRCFKRRNNRDYRSYISFIDGVRSDKIRGEYGEFSISADKFGRGLREIIGPYVNDNGYIITNQNFMNFYMTALANNICQHDSLSLLTNMAYTSGLTNTMLQEIPNQRIGANMLKQGLMYKMIIQGINIDPDTPIDKILSFREKYHDEMGDFRKQISDLVESQNTEGLSADEIVIQMKRLYSMGVLPALNNIQKALDGQRIKWVAEGGATIAVTGLTTMLAQEAIAPLSSLAQIGLKIVGKAFNYVSGRQRIIMEKPFSMLYRINQRFSKSGKR